MQKNRKTKKLSDDEQYELDKILNHQLETHNHTTEKNNIQSILKEIHIDIKCKSENQKKLINSIKEKEITICEGVPGTGKSYLACAEVLKLLKTDSKYKKIVLAKSVTTLKDEEIGYIKGTVFDKISYSFYSFTGNIEKLIGKSLLNKLMEFELIEYLPLAFIRGVSIDNSLIVIDEAQNITLDNMRTIMTRIGENSKLIILGDTRQIDIKNKKLSSLSKIMNKFENKDDFGIVRLTKEDIVRHRLIGMIEDIFDELEQENNKNNH